MTHRAWVATRKGLFEFARRGRGWQVARTHFLGEPVSMLLPPIAGQGRMLAALNLGHFGTKLHASDDAGASWHEVAVPTYPPQPPGAEGPPWKLALLWSLEAARGTVWAGTLPGGLFHSGDGGASWQLAEALWDQPGRTEWFGGGYDVPGIHSVLLHPQRAGDVLVGISCGGVWRSRDDGISWQLQADGLNAAYMPPDQAGNPNIQDPHRIARCAARPEVLWCQHHNGMWRSVDDARSWQELTGVPVSNFGFAVEAHPADPDTAWFVPAARDERRVPVDGALVVNRTRDGGRSFETLRSGLPQQDCFDLVYRHGLAVAEDGRSLLMGSTTGHLWASDDAGDTWDEVAMHLPPIHAVRWG